MPVVIGISRTLAGLYTIIFRVAACYTNAQVCLPCLFPPNLARLLPDLQELSFQCTPKQYANLQPLPYCSSLQKLTLWDSRGVRHLLPNKYHTAEELQRQLPNIDNLTLIAADHAVGDNEWMLRTGHIMLQAWGSTLTSLFLNSCIDPVKLQHCTRLHSLTCSQQNPLRSATVFYTSSITCLHVSHAIQEAGLGVILQLPSIQVIVMQMFLTSLQQD
jgi:hypothetical protein